MFSLTDSLWPVIVAVTEIVMVRKLAMVMVIVLVITMMITTTHTQAHQHKHQPQPLQRTIGNYGYPGPSKLMKE